MHRATAFVILAVMGFAGPARPAEQVLPSRSKSRLELALQYDFILGEGPKISDASGKKHRGLLKDGEIVYGRNKNAVALGGKGMISVAELPGTLDPASRSLTVGAFCHPTSPNGVVVATGDKTNGFSLYLKEGVPQFVVRASGELSKVAGTEPVAMGQWVHLAGTVDVKGKLSLVVNGWPVAMVQGKPISNTPSEGLCVGADTGSPVGEYASPFCWRGLLQDIRLYWGIVDRSENRGLWGDWANLPGCGCRK